MGETVLQGDGGRISIHRILGPITPRGKSVHIPLMSIISLVPRHIFCFLTQLAKHEWVLPVNRMLQRTAGHSLEI